MEGFGEKSISNLINSIENSRKIDLHKFIYSLGIQEVGEATSYNLAKEFKELETFLKTNFKHLIEIEDIGPKVAANIIKFLESEYSKPLIAQLIKELQIKPFKDVDSSLLTLKGLQIVLTGKLNNFSRDEIKENLISRGAKVSSNVSSKTSFVIAGENAGSKLKKAIELNVKIYDENEYESILKNPSKYT
jgi:DNA ligase (NAD+)